MNSPPTCKAMVSIAEPGNLRLMTSINQTASSLSAINLSAASLPRLAPKTNRKIGTMTGKDNRTFAASSNKIIFQLRFASLIPTKNDLIIVCSPQLIQLSACMIAWTQYIAPDDQRTAAPTPVESVLPLLVRLASSRTFRSGSISAVTSFDPVENLNFFQRSLIAQASLHCLPSLLSVS